MDEDIKTIIEQLSSANRKIMRNYLGGISAVMLMFGGFVLNNTIELNKNIIQLIEGKADKKTTLTIEKYRSIELTQFKYFYKNKMDAIKPDDIKTLEELLEM